MIQQNNKKTNKNLYQKYEHYDNKNVSNKHRLVPRFYRYSQLKYTSSSTLGFYQLYGTCTRFVLAFLIRHITNTN